MKIRIDMNIFVTWEPRNSRLLCHISCGFFTSIMCGLRADPQKIPQRKSSSNNIWRWWCAWHSFDFSFFPLLSIWIVTSSFLYFISYFRSICSCGASGTVIRMSWNQTPPSMSPHKPKVQQKSWEGTPTISLYEPNREFYDRNSSMSMTSPAVKKSPTNQSRQINFAKHCLPNPRHQLSDPGSYYSMSSPKSPSSDQFEFELSVTPQHSSRSPLKSVAPNRRYCDDTSTSDPTSATISSSSIAPRKFEFGAVSPKFDNPGKLKWYAWRKATPVYFDFCLQKLCESIIHGARKPFSHLQAQKNLNTLRQQRRRPKTQKWRKSRWMRRWLNYTAFTGTKRPISHQQWHRSWKIKSSSRRAVRGKTGTWRSATTMSRQMAYLRWTSTRLPPLHTKPTHCLAGGGCQLRSPTATAAAKWAANRRWLPSRWRRQAC